MLTRGCGWAVLCVLMSTPLARAQQPTPAPRPALEADLGDAGPSAVRLGIVAGPSDGGGWALSQLRTGVGVLAFLAADFGSRYQLRLGGMHRRWPDRYAGRPGERRATLQAVQLETLFTIVRSSVVLRSGPRAFLVRYRRPAFGNIDDLALAGGWTLIVERPIWRGVVAEAAAAVWSMGVEFGSPTITASAWNAELLLGASIRIAGGAGQ